MLFSVALEYMRNGDRVSRADWEGSGSFIFWMPGASFVVSEPPLLGIYPENTTVKFHDYIAVRTDDDWIEPWVAPHEDLTADDWQIADPL